MICLPLFFIKINAAANSPVMQRFFNILLGEVKVLCQLPRLGETILKGLTQLLCREIMFCGPAICPVLTALYKLIGAVYFMECARGCVAKLVVADAFE